MNAFVPFASISTLSTGTYLIFTVAAFFALCAVVSYFVASALENSRRDAAAHARLRDQFAARTEEPAEAVIRSDDEPARHLQWPDDDPHKP